jgi:hypothetical protein
MEQNVGKFDRVIRIALGGALGTGAVATAWFGTSLGGAAELALAGVLLVAGLVLVGTAAARVCPVYRVLGVDTCGVRDRVRRGRRGRNRTGNPDGRDARSDGGRPDEER